MHFDPRFFQSRVARRMFLLFVMSALTPLASLILLAMFQLDLQMSENSRQQIRREAKNAGMELLERLFHFEGELMLAGRALAGHGGRTAGDPDRELDRIAPDFARLTLVHPSGLAMPILGEALEPPPDMPATQTRTSQLVLAHDATGRNPARVILAHATRAGLLLGELRPESVWSFDLNAGTLVWVLDPAGNLLYRNSREPPPEQLAGLRASNVTGAFPWETKEESRFAGYWTLFLRQRFGSGDATLVLSAPKASILSQGELFDRIFLPTLLFALLLAMLLSLSQIRRLLVPMERLGAATLRVAQRDFSQQVEVKSGDEFEELARAFNLMSKRLDRQFHALSIMSTLDRAILSAMDGEQVVRLIFVTLREIVDYDLLVIGLPEAATASSMRLLVDDPARGGMREETVVITPADLATLGHDSAFTLHIESAPPPGYLGAFGGHSARHFLVFPLRHNEQPVAVICMGFTDPGALDDYNTEELRDLFSRASVAFTNAEWEERLYRQAHYDTLTDLPNRLVLRDQLKLALERAARHGYHGALMFIDLDNFKAVNDALGHATGDQFLVQVARAMHSAIRHSDTLVRLGGDEFIILITDIGNVDLATTVATKAATQILQALARPFIVAGSEIRTSASIGIAIYPDDGDNGEDLLKFADMAMYQAKEAGKNRYVFFRRDFQNAVLERNQLLQEMQRALEQDQFQLYFQPKVDTRSGTLAGAEALVRWRHPRLGMISPATFLPLAEESGLIVPLGEWVLRAACLQLRDWLDGGHAIGHLAVNIASKQFSQSDLAGVTRPILADSGIDPGCLEFEITEGTVIGNVRDAAGTLNQLRDLGIRLAIDDFGTGYSSLSYLKHLPVDIIKIDQSFIGGLPDDRENLSIVRAIIALAQSLELDLVAEGVETQAQAEALRELGCDVHQGYLYGPPLPAGEFAARHLAG